MSDQPRKKTTDRGVVESIAWLREQRYLTKGMGQYEIRGKRKPAPLASVDQLRDKVSKVAVKSRKKKSKQKRGKR